MVGVRSRHNVVVSRTCIITPASRADNFPPDFSTRDLQTSPLHTVDPGSMGIYSSKSGGWGVGKIRLFFKNSMKNKEFLEKIAFFG